MSAPNATNTQLGPWQRRSLFIGVGGLGLCVIGAFFNPAQFFSSYLLAQLFWLGIALGCLAVVMLHHLVGGMWGVVIRPLLESGTKTLPLMALLFLPVLFGVGEIYSWATPQGADGAHSENYRWYLNVPGFWIRAILYFAIWIGLAFLLSKWFGEYSRTRNPVIARRLRGLSAVGLALYALTATFAAVDWVMSLEPQWYSTIYGLIHISGQALAAFSFVLVGIWVLPDKSSLPETILTSHLHDLGNFLLLFVMLWAYMAFSQFLVIWSGNLPEEIPWYLHRTRGPWAWIAMVLILFHFALPFVLLLLRRNKREIATLSVIAAALLMMRWVDLLWMINPAFPARGMPIHWMDVVAPIGIGGLWIALFLWRMQETLTHGQPNHG